MQDSHGGGGLLRRSPSLAPKRRRSVGTGEARRVCWCSSSPPGAEKGPWFVMAPSLTRRAACRRASNPGHQLGKTLAVRRSRGWLTAWRPGPWTTYGRAFSCRPRKLAGFPTTARPGRAPASMPASSPRLADVVLPAVPRRAVRAMLTKVNQTSSRGPAPGSGWLRPAADVAVTAGGAVLVFLTTILWGVQSHGRVDPRDLVLGPATPMDGQWFAALTVSTAALLATAGLPGDRRSDRALGSAVGQAAGALAAAAGTLAGASIGSIWLYGPQDRCAYVSCWPATAQAVAAAVPGALAAMALVAMAVLVRRLAWRTRAVLPAATWLVSLLALRAAWEPLVVPILQAPPP